MIEADSAAMTSDLQTLIAYGKKLEQNEKTLGEYEIKDGNFMIVMIAKVRILLPNNS
jgi:beta-galactosidase beta subunit